MASASPNYLTLLALAIAALLHLVTGMPWIEPQITPMGLMAVNGFSPRPTTAPGAAAGELFAKRGCTSPDPWLCGYAGGGTDLSNAITCITTDTCIFSGTAVGCCTNSDIQLCSDLFTACIPYAGDCGAACIANPAVLYCAELARPLCWTATYYGGKVGYGCDDGGELESVAWPWQALPSICSPQPTIIVTQPITTQPPRPSVSTTLPTAPSATPSATHKSAVSAGAIAGASIGGLAILAAIAAGLFYFCIIVRRRRDGGLPAMAGTTGVASAAPPYNPQNNQYAPASPAQDMKPPINSYGAGAATGGGYNPQPQQQYPSSPTSQTFTPPSPYGSPQMGSGPMPPTYSDWPGGYSQGGGYVPARVTSPELHGGVGMERDERVQSVEVDGIEVTGPRK